MKKTNKIRAGDYIYLKEIDDIRKVYGVIKGYVWVWSAVKGLEKYRVKWSEIKMALRPIK